MKQIKILGPGCRRCEQLAAATKEAADQLGIDYELEKVKDVAKLADYGVMMTPGLVIDGEVKSQGKVLSLDEIKAMLA
ncbi:MAG: redox-active disulfide protein 2 [Spirochaetes bacterium RBG_13_68_11]|jgi:small redox-active disulfide protein 2|nr:MAG: redox-active disulfide protein 2 [Spirochaetes bacterium RBG_13_68_11]